MIRRKYPKGGWDAVLSDGRVQKAKEVLADRKRRNEHIDLADCLQFGDKRDILLEDKELLTHLGFSSKGQAEKLLSSLEHLRDELAHAQDIIGGFWPELVSLCEKGQDFLEKAEKQNGAG
jgi:hypothetical protein